MKPRTRLLLALLLLLAVISWWLALDRPERPEEPASNVAQPPESEPTPQVAPPATPTAATTPEPPPNAANPPPPAAPTDETTQPAAAPRPPDTRGWVNALQMRYENDAQDPAAGTSEAALRAELGNLQLPPSLVRSVACRATMCKLELRWVAEQNSAYLALTAHLMGDNAKFFATRAQDPDTNGVALVDAYWFRR